MTPEASFKELIEHSRRIGLNKFYGPNEIMHEVHISNTHQYTLPQYEYTLLTIIKYIER